MAATREKRKNLLVALLIVVCVSGLIGVVSIGALGIFLIAMPLIGLVTGYLMARS